MEYHSALLLAANGEKNVTINTIAPDATFGQWWAQLKDAFHSPEARQWIEEKGINTSSIKLNPQSGQISFKRQRHLDPEQKLHTVGQDDWQWAALSRPILQAARVISAEHPDTTFTPPATDLDQPVPYWLVGRFYKEQLNLTGPSMRQRAAEIVRDQGFTKLDPGTFSRLIQSRSEDALQNQKAHLGDTHDRYQAVAELRHLAASMEGGIEYIGQINDELKNRTIELSFDSTYPPSRTAPSNKVSLLQFLEDHGWDIPANHEQLVNLATALSTLTPKAPINGNLGGALAWPVPLDQNSVEQLRTDIRAGMFGDIALAPFDNVLDYLLNNRPVSAEEWSNPRALIEALISSSRGKALGSAIQSTFEARTVKGSTSDWLLAALSIESNGTADGGVNRQSSGQIEGYPLVTPENTGKPCATILKELAGHLVAKGRAASPEKAAVLAHLLLARRAPEFLVKNIPNQVTVGTHSWVSFVTATARLEAKAPGASATMSYAQIMLAASTAPITDAERQVEYAAQNEAIKDWGVANGMSYAVDKATLATVREAFNAQIRELKEASETQQPTMPTTKAIALEQLKKALPGMDPELFEKKCITSQPSSRYFPGPYSILDMFIDGRGLLGVPDSADNWGEHGRSFIKSLTSGAISIDPDGKPAAWVSSSDAININDVLVTLKQLPPPLDAFSKTFSDYANTVKKTTAAQLKLLISKLPLEDRKNLEFGKLSIRKEIRYLRNDDLKRVAPGVLLVKTERNGNIMTYAIDRLKGTVTKQPDQSYKEYAPSTGLTHISRGKRFDVVEPSGKYSPGITEENNTAQNAPNSFSSLRTQYIVDAMIADMDLPAVKKFAKGATTFETEVPTYKIIEEVALGLIPFRSAIKNFIDGKVGDGLVDLAFDIFGFAVGLGVAAKGAKALTIGASALSKLARAGKVIGRATVGALNPLGGIDDLARGVVSLGRAAHKGVKYLRGSYRNVNLLELAKKPDITEGTYKLSNSTLESRSLAKFDEATHKWYAFDPRTQQAYGKPLNNFAATPPKPNDPNSLPAIGSDDVAKIASQQHGLAASGTFKIGQETLEGNVILFQGNWHQYDVLKKRAFGPPLRDFTPSRVAANGEVKSLSTDLLGYEVKHIAPDELKVKGLQGNVYVGRSNKEYVKIDGLLYESRLKEGQRVIRHAGGTAADIPVRDLGVSGWEPTSRANRLLGGVDTPPTPWRLGDSTYVVPMDGIKKTENSVSPYSLNYKAAEHHVVFDSTAGTWKTTDIEGQNPMYFWREGKGKWQRGTLNDFVKAKKTDAHKFEFVDISSQTIIKVPIDAKPLPKELHYFWAGQDIPSHLISNMAQNATKAPGYKSILHVDADNPIIFQKIKNNLESKAPGLTVINLNEDEAFKQLKNSEIYDYFRQGQGKNLAAASDVARYPIMYKHGGIYLDTDDVIGANIGNIVLKANANDIILNNPVWHRVAGDKLFYNTSNFATQPGNPVLMDMSARMQKQFTDNKPYFLTNRPTVATGADGSIQYTPEFNQYESKIFETVGPTLFNDILKSKRPDMYNLGFDGLTKEVKFVDGGFVSIGPKVNIEAGLRQLYASKGIAPPNNLNLQIVLMKNHYNALFHKLKVKIGTGLAPTRPDTNSPLN